MTLPRTTRHLPPRAAANFSRAVTFAAESGIPLTHMVSINYGLTCSGEAEMVAAFRRLLKSFFVKWVTRHPTCRGLLPAKRAATYVWVAEGRGGHHGIHWLVRIPAGRLDEFKRELRRWLDCTAGPVLDGKAIDVRSLYNAKGARDYLLKGLQEKDARRYGVKWSSQGQVYGKRCGVSENLGPTAIKRARAIGLTPSLVVGG